MLPFDHIGVIIGCITRDQMHMIMEHRLSCNFSVILDHVISITFQYLFLMRDDLFGKPGCLCQYLFINLINIGIMLFRKDQCMAL